MRLVHLLLMLQSQPFQLLLHPGADPGVDNRLRALCPAADSADGGALLNREYHAGSAAPLRGAAADAWTLLGCIRVRLSFAGVPAREGTRMPLGFIWERGALNAMLESIERHPTDTVAAEVSALLALREQEPLRLKEIMAALEGSLHAGVATPAVLRACSELELRLGRDSLARGCAERGLALGRDSTWQLIRLARLSLHRNDTASVNSLFIRAAGASHTIGDVDELEWHLQWFLTPDEVREWPTVAGADRAKWVRDRIAGRDVRDGQPPGSRLMAHFSRLEFVLAHFWTRVPDAMKHLTLQRRTGVATIGMKCSGINGGMFPSGSAGAAPRWQTEFDDRGVVYMRLGAPDERYYWGCDFARELWIYHIDGQQYFLQFQDEDYNGSKEATRLVTGVIDPFFCGIDPLRCQASADYASAAVRTLINEQDRRSARFGTLQDDNSVRGGKQIRVVSQFLRLWDPADQTPFNLLAYAIRIDDLALQPDGAGKSGAVDLLFRQWDSEKGRENALTVTRSLTLPPEPVRATRVPALDSIARIRYLTGVLTPVTEPGVGAWSLIATQPDAARGRATADPKSALPATDLALSDLVLGAIGQGLTFDQFSRSIVLGPLGAFNHREPVTLYYQVRSTIGRTAVTTAIELFRTSGPQAGRDAVLSLNYSGPLEPGVNEITRGLDVSFLPVGEYRIEVVMTDPIREVVAHQTAVLDLY